MSIDLCIKTINASAERRLLADELTRFNLERVGEGTVREIMVSARDPQGTLVGGASGQTFWGWLHVQDLWVHASARGAGLGSRLMDAIEAEAVRQGCTGAHLDTFSFQARPFYERRGYEVFGVLEGFPPPHARYFLKKRLGPAG